MRIAIVTKVLIGGFEVHHAGLKGGLIGGAEVYLLTLIKEVLEKFASEIVVYQTKGISKQLSDKTAVITVKSVNELDLNRFDLVIVNGMQQTIASEIEQLRTKSIGIHHGMLLPPPLNFDTIRTHYEYAELFGITNSKVYHLVGHLSGNFVNLSLKFLRVLQCEHIFEQQRTYLLNILKENSAKVDCVVSVDSDSLRYVDLERRRSWKVIRNFVDLRLIKPHIPRRKSFQGITVLVPRNLVLARGVHIVPKLACLLKKDGYRNFRFAIAGMGPLRQYLENETSRLNLEKEVVLLGHQDHFKDMAHLYADSDIVLVPSLASEGTSLAVLEGMASKRPVVTTDVGGITEIGFNGRQKLSSSFSAEKIARNIALLLDDKNLMNKIAEEGYQYVCHKHTVDLWREKWTNTIKEFMM